MTIAAHIKETQAKIRAMAVNPKTRDRARALVNPSNYYIRKVRTVIDGDCDGVTYGWVWHLDYDGPHTLGIQTVSVHATIGEAEKALNGRAAALDGADCADWAWCGVPAPADFVP